jgi:undecaprenyl-diphosphatase
VAAESIYAYLVAAIPLILTGRVLWWQLFLSFLTTYAAVNLLQHLIKRHRPDFEKLTGYKMWVHTYSYPSGHAAMSANLAASLVDFTTFPSLSLTLIAAISAFLLAALIGLARVVVGVHYLADVIFGWFLGFVIAWTYAAILGL